MNLERLLSIQDRDQLQSVLQDSCPRDQLSLCQTIIREGHSVANHSHRAIFVAWQWIDQYQLYREDGVGREIYLEQIGSGNNIREILEIEKRKDSARRKIKSRWHQSAEDVLGDLCPGFLGRDLLESLAQLSELCHSSEDALRCLKSSMGSRPRRSRKTAFVTARDIERATEKFRHAIAKGSSIAKAKKKRENRNCSHSSVMQQPVSKRPSIVDHHVAPETSVQQRLRTRSQPNTVKKLKGSNSSLSTSTELQLQDRFPCSLPGLLDRLRRAFADAQIQIPESTHGGHAIVTIARLLERVRPAIVYVDGVEEGIKYQDYQTASRSSAQILCLDDAAAISAVANGPVDGRSVIVRRSNDVVPSGIQQILDAIRQSWMGKIDTQQPWNDLHSDSYESIPASKICQTFEAIAAGEKTIGFGDGQVPPMNILSLPSFQGRIPRCLCSSRDTQVLQTIRISLESSWLEIQRRLHASKRRKFVPTWFRGDDSFTLLALNLALTLPHEDHDGFGTYIFQCSGYKLWLFWNMTESLWSDFANEGDSFCEDGVLLRSARPR